MTDVIRNEVDLVSAADQLSRSLRALRMALEANDLAPGVLCILEDASTPADGLELRRRWAAASLLMHGVVEAVERDGKTAVDAVHTLLAL